MVEALCAVFVPGEGDYSVREVINHCVIGGRIITSDTEKLKDKGKYSFISVK